MFATGLEHLPNYHDQFLLKSYEILADDLLPEMREGSRLKRLKLALFKDFFLEIENRISQVYSTYKSSLKIEFIIYFHHI